MIADWRNLRRVWRLKLMLSILIMLVCVASRVAMDWCREPIHSCNSIAGAVSFTSDPSSFVNLMCVYNQFNADGLLRWNE